MRIVQPDSLDAADFAPGRSEEVVEDVVDRPRRLLRDTDFASWRRQVTDIAPLGEVALLDLADASMSCLGKFDASAMLKLGETCLHVGELADDDMARTMLRVARSAVHHAPSGAVYAEYLDALVTVARQMPLALPSLFDRQADILPVLDARKLKHWIGARLAISAWDKDGGRAYFRLESGEAKRLLSQMSGNVAFDDVAVSVGAFLRALWGFHPVIVSVSGETIPQGARTSFSGSFVRVPEFYPGTNGEVAARQFRGALAHIAAHMVHGRGPEVVGKLKPVQVALISLIEDARVENLAAEELPGLGKLWAGLHTALPGAAVTVDKLLARLSRALADPDYIDGNPWVEKGRRLFFEQRGSWGEEGFSRALGGALGHDLGQMRIPFNAKTYVVQPGYRDDNSGLWERRPEDDSGDLRGMLSTRLGAALRHSGARLARQRSERRLVLVVTDGEPSDIDVADERYLVEDARQAVHELNHGGIDVFAAALGSHGRSSLPRMFSRRGYMAIDSIEQLPLHLTKIYHRLAG
ncbi:hypothetical protein [Pseudochelatococcus sp.]|jgi:nitric oxide reductase NorD protein|uniref:hypothetical protein n=1 Tax=Pseudochelatococcus sp. TaxID=2020869 RepID=UPI003D8CD3B5